MDCRYCGEEFFVKEPWEAHEERHLDEETQVAMDFLGSIYKEAVNG